MVNILKNCSEIDQTSQNWKKFEIIKSLCRLAERVNDKIIEPSSSTIKNNPRKKLLYPILQTFANLSNNNLADFQYMLADSNANDLLEKLKEDKEDLEIRRTADEILSGLMITSETLHPESYDIAEKINEIVQEKCTADQRLLELQNIETVLLQKK